jgi:hypothetical protein
MTEQTMTKLTEAQRQLVLHFEDYSVKSLYSLIGSAATESGNATVQQRYVLGTPDIDDRGSGIVAEVRKKVCESRVQLNRMAKDHEDVLGPIEWVSVILDVVVAATLTWGVPPIAVATALGKLCNRSLARLCPEAAASAPPKAGG